MKKFTILLNLLTGVFVLSFSDFSFAQGCVVTGATGGGGEVVVCDGEDNDGLVTTENPDVITVEPGADLTRAGNDVIRTEAGNDFVEINGGMITGSSGDIERCILMGAGVNELIMRDGTLRCGGGIRCIDGSSCKITIEGGTVEGISQVSSGEEAIETSSGSNEIYINGGTLTATDGVIEANDGDDTIIITGGVLKQLDNSDETVSGRGGNDLISVSNANIDGSMAMPQEAIDGNEGNDEVRLGTGAEVLGIISGGEDFDTLAFEMEVSESLIPSLCSQIVAMDPAEGEITINGLLYEWDEFEQILCELVPRNPDRIAPIPTLSQWGMIAMVGVIGIAGVLFVVRRRKSAAM